MNRFFTLLFAASCLTAVGQVDLQFRFLQESVHHIPRTTEIKFFSDSAEIAFDPTSWFRSEEESGAFEDNVQGEFVEPYPFGYSVNCNDQGWIIPWGATMQFTANEYPNRFAVHTSCFCDYPSAVIEVSVQSDLQWLVLGSFVYDPDDCGWTDFNLPPFLEAGCTDSTACNYNSDAQIDDGSCHFNCQFCHDGTVWDEELFKCVVANPSDSNFDGCVQLNDLLDLLTAYGDCGAEESAWQCGDPLEYQGYDYETVQIGEQCWFAENLRAVSFSNGDLLQSDLNGGEWQSTNSAAYCFYEDDASMEYLNGLLYNGFAVTDDRKLCPLEWKVPSSQDWQTIISIHGLSGLKATPNDVPGWNGDNSTGLSLAPNGLRYDWAYFDDIGAFGGWWTESQPNPDFVDYLHLESSFGALQNDPINYGYSIRCIKDSE